jgi:hypothetical protein
LGKNECGEDCTNELREVRRAARKWNNCGGNFSFPSIQLGEQDRLRGVDHSDGENQRGWPQTWASACDTNALAVSSILSNAVSILSCKLLIFQAVPS